MQTSEESQPVAGDAPQAPEAVVPEAHGEAQPQVHLPLSSIWPMTTAGGVALLGFGLVTTPVFTFIGLILMFFGIVYWIQELRHEPH